MTAQGENAGGGSRIQVHLKNNGTVAALETKLVTIDASDGSEVLPAYYSDNYVSLLPGEERTVTISVPANGRENGLRLELRGWNVTPASLSVR